MQIEQRRGREKNSQRGKRKRLRYPESQANKVYQGEQVVSVSPVCLLAQLQVQDGQTESTRTVILSTKHDEMREKEGSIIIILMIILPEESEIF